MATRPPGGGRNRRDTRRDGAGGRPARRPQDRRRQEEPRRREEPAPGSYHHGERARELLREGMARHGCATTRQLADKLGVPHGPRLLTAIGYRGNAPAAWRDLAPELAGEPDQATTNQGADEPARDGRPSAEEDRQ